MKQKIKCLKCDHEWITRSNMKFVSCPSCLGKVKNNIEKGSFGEVKND